MADRFPRLIGDAGHQTLQQLVSLAKENAEVGSKAEDRLASEEHRTYLRWQTSKDAMDLEKLKQENLSKRIQLVSAHSSASFAERREILAFHKTLYNDNPEL
jgi:hypothetical protein